MEPLPNAVLVGVTGRGENTLALRHALSEAERLQCGVTVVHAVHPFLPPPPTGVPMTDDTWSNVGSKVVGEVLEELSGLNQRDVPTSAVTRYGDPGPVFAELSTDSRMIVLQHRDLSRLHRLVTGSTVAAVAHHAHCPIVSVPGSVPAHTTGTIAVGVDQDGGPRSVLEAAFVQSAAHRCALRVVHASRPPSAYEAEVPDPAGWVSRIEPVLDAVVTPLRQQYGDVDVVTDVRYSWAADALVEVSDSVDLLVLGRHSAAHLVPRRLGSVTRAAIAHGRCPVMVIPTGERRDLRHAS